MNGLNVLIFGAGGAASAAVSIFEPTESKVHIANRTHPRAKALANKFGHEAISIKEASDNIGRYDVIFDATGQGIKHGESPIPIEYLIPGQIIFDMAYVANQNSTPLLDEARKKNTITISGLEMLWWQGIAQAELFTGRLIPQEIRNLMAKALQL